MPVPLIATMPRGMAAFYVQLPWGDTLMVYEAGAGRGSHPFSHALEVSKVDSALIPMGLQTTVEGKRRVWVKLVANGFIEMTGRRGDRESVFAHTRSQ